MRLSFEIFREHFRIYRTLKTFIDVYQKTQEIVFSQGIDRSMLFLVLLTDMPTLSGVSDMDYPLQGPGLLSVPTLPELSAVRRVPLPPELVEQFSRILFSFKQCL